MPTHWTYADTTPDDDLVQGDILAPVDGLRRLFGQVHPHFCDEKYLAFVVITQTCDLARREGVCSARYLNVAAVRSLSEVLPTLLSTVCCELNDGVYNESDKSKAYSLLERLFNQNEQKLGLFYLFPDADAGIGEDAVAFLRVSVAFRAEHYDLMCQARCGRLESTFANKLGWLVGNLYTRAGTQDWPKEELGSMIKDHLSAKGRRGPYWVKSRLVKHLAKTRKDLQELTREEWIEMIGIDIPRPKDVGIDCILAVVREIAPSLDEPTIEKLRTRLKNNVPLTNTFR